MALKTAPARLGAIMTGAFLLGAASTAQATPIVTFLIDGDTFSQPFSVTNSSDGGEQIIRFQMDLSTIPGGGFCYDTVFGGPCRLVANSEGPFASAGGTAATTGLIGSDAANNPTDGSTLLDISFSDFDAGETFMFDIDVDHVDNSTVTGDEMIGATALIDFSDGQRLTGIFVAVTSNPDASTFSAIGLTQTPSIPEPGTLALFGLGLAGLGFARRRKTV